MIQKVAEKTKIVVGLGDRELTEKGTHIIVASPQWIASRLGGKTAINLKALKMVVFDEADEIFFQPANRPLITKLLAHTKKLNLQVQGILFSATFPKEVLETVLAVFQDPEMMINLVKKECLQLKGVKQFKILKEYYRAFDAKTQREQEDCYKEEFIREVYDSIQESQTMIFVNMKPTAEKLQTKLKEIGIVAHILINKMDKAERDRVIDDFRKQSITCLICTNVLARGIDVPEVDLVINYDVPIINFCGWKEPDIPNYLHRIGRTGRFGTDGVALSIYSDEAEHDALHAIQDYYEVKIKNISSVQELKFVLDKMRNRDVDDD